MALGTYLRRRGAVYYNVMPIPADLQGAMEDKRQIWTSLRTKDPREAKRLNSSVTSELMAEFEELRRRRELANQDIETAVWDHYNRGVSIGDKERIRRPSQSDIDRAVDKAFASLRRNNYQSPDEIDSINAMGEVELMASAGDIARWRRTRLLKRLRKDVVAGNLELAEPHADAFLKEFGFLIDKHSDRYRELCHKLMRADIEQLQRYLEREKGIFNGVPSDPIIVEPSHRTEPLGNGDQTIMGLFDSYEKEKRHAVRVDGLNQARRDIRHFVNFSGPQMRPENINKKYVREWKAALSQWPVKAAEIAAFEGLSAREVIAANSKLAEPKPVIANNTIRRYLSGLSGFCEWLVQHDYLATNPVSGMFPPKSSPAQPRESFSDEAMERLFASPLFNTSQGKKWSDLHKPGNIAIRDHRYWIPLVMAYSGARIAEIAQLQTHDVRQLHDVWILHITDAGDGNKRVKTKGSTRVVPIHSELIRLGFVDHCKAMKAVGEKQVFPEVDIPETGQIAAQFSREFNRYLEKLGLKTGRNIVTYSFRHTFIDRARLAGFLDEEIGAVVGHGSASMTAKYGSESQVTVERRKVIVDSVRYAATLGQ